MLRAGDRKYLQVAMPAALEGLFMVLLSSVDIIMVGVLGTAAIAAVSIFTQPRMMLLCVVRSVASVLTLLTARKYGEKNIVKHLAVVNIAGINMKAQDEIMAVTGSICDICHTTLVFPLYK